jgi:hypothetical protein
MLDNKVKVCYAPIMRCIHVVKGKHKTKHGNANINYSCRKCLPCLITRRQEWTGRLLLEMRSSIYTYYVTLTYGPHTLPSQNTLVKKDLQDYIKRLRFHIGSELRYFACGEYGEKRGRPHYHILIFTNKEINVRYGLCPERKKMCSVDGAFHKAWTLDGILSGLVDVVPIFGRADCKRVGAYIAGYVLKKIGIPEDLPEGKIEEFQLMSRRPAIGAKYVDSLVLKMKKQGLKPQHYDGVAIGNSLQMITIDGKLYPLGRTLREKVLEHFDGEPTPMYKALAQHNRAFLEFVEQDTEEYIKQQGHNEALAKKMFQKYYERRMRDNTING